MPSITLVLASLSRNKERVWQTSEPHQTPQLLTTFGPYTETLLPGNSMIFESYQCCVKITTICLHIYLISMPKSDGADSPAVLLPIYQTTQCHVPEHHNLNILRLLEPRFYSGSLFVQETLERSIDSVYVVWSHFYLRFSNCLLDCHKQQSSFKNYEQNCEMCIFNDSNMTAMKCKPY